MYKALLQNLTNVIMMYWIGWHGSHVPEWLVWLLPSHKTEHCQGVNLNSPWCSLLWWSKLSIGVPGTPYFWQCIQRPLLAYFVPLIKGTLNLPPIFCCFSSSFFFYGIKKYGWIVFSCQNHEEEEEYKITPGETWRHEQCTVRALHQLSILLKER